MQLLPDAVVSVRRCRWRVRSVRQYDDCALITLQGLSPPWTGKERRLLFPFDRFERVEPRTRPRIVTRRQWRHACRAALVDAAPPGALRSAASARIDLLPYQLEPALAIVRGDACRLLLADDVGLGKTVQAGLIASELLLRAAVARVLVLTPAGLRDQWCAELRSRFNLAPLQVDARVIREVSTALPSDVDPWSTLEIAVASIDYVKRSDVLAAVARRPWDLVIVDEAHGSASDSDRRAAVDALCTRATYVLLLSATPHNGDAAAFASLCRLGQVGNDSLLVFRRTRQDAGIVVRRRVHALHVRLGARERQLHAALRRFSDAVVAERPDAWLALSVLHKRAFSSAAALAASVERRLSALGAEPAADDASQLVLPLDEGGAIAADEPPAWAPELTLSSAARERHLLDRLACAAHAASLRESKIAALARLLRRIRESVLIFTEYRDTLRHLQRSIPRTTVVLHGGLSPDERQKAVDEFVRTPGAVMLATDAAGEGLNLHAACRLVVNLELPWNPMRLEQRIGRVDRIGQRRPVHAVHLIARNTGETQVLARLHARVVRARSSIGAPDPLGIAAERIAAELVVLRREPHEAALTPTTIDDPGRIDRSQDARAETARLAQLRRVAASGKGQPAAPGHGPWIVRARSRLRRQLAGRRLEIWLVAADDRSGRRVESHLIGLEVANACGDATAAVAAAAKRWEDAVRQATTRFAGARYRRSLDVGHHERATVETLQQPALFEDRRRARERLATAAERVCRLEFIEARTVDALDATSLTIRLSELLFVVLTSR